MVKSKWFHSYFPFKKPTLAFFFFPSLELMTHGTILHSLAATESRDTPSQFSRRKSQGPGAPQFLQWSCWGSCLPEPQRGMCCHNPSNKHLPSNSAWDSLLLIKKHALKSFHFGLAKMSFQKCSNKTGFTPSSLNRFWIRMTHCWDCYMVPQLEWNS